MTQNKIRQEVLNNPRYKGEGSSRPVELKLKKTGSSRKPWPQEKQENLNNKRVHSTKKNSAKL
jgi:hypothetical protein